MQKASKIRDPHEQAFFAMVQLPYLKPFDDVNKRVSRLAANIPLIKHNRVPISFIGVPEDLYLKGLLGIYERNRVELLKDVFIWTCERSAERYIQVKQTISEPDPFRMKYRQELQKVIAEIITRNLDHAAAMAVIDPAGTTILPTDAKTFRELVETELRSLHEGNFARYKVSPSEFKKWKENF